MNHKYFVDLKKEARKTGDIAFFMAIIKVLKRADAFCGVILYRKEKDQNPPALSYTTINDANCAVLSFGDEVLTVLFQSAITEACEHLTELAGCCPHIVKVPFLYHQDEKLLEAHP